MASTYTNRRAGDAAARQVTSFDKSKPAAHSQFVAKKQHPLRPPRPWINLGDITAVLLAKLAKGGAP